MAEVKRQAVYILHIVEAIDRIASHIKGLTFADFKGSTMVQDAVIRQVEIIGEATKHIIDETRKRYPEVPWRIMAAMRDKAKHDYFDVDIALVWETAAKDIPSPKAVMDRISRDLEGAH